MQAGFTALESGLVRLRNSINVANKNFANFLVAASLFWLFGFGLMFGRSAGGLIGSTSFLFSSHSAYLTAYFVFQLGFIESTHSDPPSRILPSSDTQIKASDP